MNTTKYEIELPTLPDGWEIVGYGKPKKGMLFLLTGTWQESGIDFQKEECMIARRKRTLADWANEQPLFKALVEMRIGQKATGLIHIHGTFWSVTSPDSIGGVLTINAPEPIVNKHGKLTLENGKWKDVQ